MPPERRCPACGIALDPLHVPDKYGRETQIDQCPECRGIYFDKDELFRMGPALVDPLELVAPSPEASLEKTGGGPCPGCGAVLARMGSLNLPQEVHAWQCTSCAGFWLSEADLYEFYQFRKAQIAKMREQERQGPSPLVQAMAYDAAMKSLRKEVTTKILYPAAVMVSPAWIGAGLIAAEKLWEHLKTRFGGQEGEEVPDELLESETEKKD